MSGRDTGISLSDDPLHPRIGEFSIGRAIHSALRALSRNGHARPDGLEREISDEIAVRFRHPARGLYIPLSAPLRSGRAAAERRTGFVDTTTASGLIESVRRPGVFLDALRSKMVCSLLGASTIELPRGHFTVIPRFTQASTAQWITEDTAATPSNSVVDNGDLKDGTISSTTCVSRRMLLSCFEAAETFFGGEMARSIAVALDAAALNGPAGDTPGPTGILNNALAQQYGPLGANGGGLALADLCAMEALVGNANGGSTGSTGWVAAPNARSKLRRTEKVANTGKMLWNDQNMMLGSPALATTSMPSAGTEGTGTNLSSLIFGDFSQIQFATMGAVDILLNPYAKAPVWGVTVSAFVDAWANCIHPQAFIYVNDYVTT